MGLNTEWQQVNNSMSVRSGTLRGLHFQVSPHAEVKLVRCIHGTVWDVVVDLRSSSNTYRHWFGTEISARNRTMMYVPEGFAHGFLSLSPNAEIIYFVSSVYEPEAERILLWNDSDVGIKWPKTPTCMSEKDAAGAPLKILEQSLCVF